MKQLMTTGLLVVSVFAASARSSSSKSNTLAAKTRTILENARMEITGDHVQFKNLPKQATELYIMDDQGIVEQSGVVNRKDNKVNIADLPKGNHLFALKIGLKVKVFGYMAEVVIKP